MIYLTNNLLPSDSRRIQQGPAARPQGNLPLSSSENPLIRAYSCSLLSSGGNSLLRHAYDCCLISAKSLLSEVLSRIGTVGRVFHSSSGQSGALSYSQMGQKLDTVVFIGWFLSCPLRDESLHNYSDTHTS